MVITPLRAFLFVAAAVVAAAGTAYFAGAFDVRLGGATNDVAAPEADSTPGKDSRVAAKTQDQSGANAPAEGASGEVGANGGKADASKAASDEEADKLVVPTFDVVRVEPDGSMVVAGSAAPGSDVEIVSGATIVGKAKAGPEGDFAVALDDPLEPGDYQLVLRATSPDHIVATSKETAVVSIPDNPQGQVLALVEEPGEPSRLITVPKAQEPSDDIATVAPEDEQKAPVAGAGSDDGRQTPDAAAAPKGEAPSMASGSEAAGKSADSKQATKPTTGEGEGTDVATGGGQAERTASQAEESGGAPEDAAEKTARTARNSGTAAETGGAAAPAEEPGAGGGETGNAAEIAAAEPLPEQPAEAAPSGNAAGQEQPTASASQSPAASASQPAADSVSQPNVFIEAVEIDGDKVFVAGSSSEPGMQVRVYANEVLLGLARVSPGGRFLVEATRDLPVGDYIVRADLLAENGLDVIARAAVPFEREAGSRIAAVAPQLSAPAAEPGPAAEENATRSGKEPASETASRSDSQPVGAEDTGNRQAPADAEQKRIGQGAEESEHASTDSPASQETAVARKQDDGTGEGGQPAASSAEPRSAGQAADGDGTTQDGSEMKAAAAGTLSQPEDQQTVTAPKLEPVDHAVIIRRGDTLWQISRRVYGRGIRYTTIYLANKDQIRDPHWIWPGQIFAVPEETAEGVPADMSAIADQAVPLPEKRQQ